MISTPTTLAVEFDVRGAIAPVAETQNHDGLAQVLIANDGEVLARLRLSAAEAARVCNVTPRQLIYWTKKAAQVVQREMGTLQAEAKRLEEMTPDALEDELRSRLERLEARISELRRALPASLTIARLRKAVGVLARLDAQGALDGTQGTNGDTAKAVSLRLGRAIDELEMLLREVAPVGA
jgi:DNA-binding transcriptional MerR regulator